MKNMILLSNNRNLHHVIMHGMRLFIMLLCSSANVLLGSATPSLESYYNATTGKYGLVELNERYGDVQLPAIEIIDTKKIIRKDKIKGDAFTAVDRRDQ